MLSLGLNQVIMLNVADDVCHYAVCHYTVLLIRPF